MTRNADSSPSPARPLDAMRKIALIGGVLYLITFAASIPQLKLFDTVIDDRDFILGAGSNTAMLWGCVLEIITAAAGIGTAVALYPVTKRVSQTAAIGFITSRVVEGALIVVGVMSLLALVTMREDLAGASGPRADALVITGQSLVELRQATFLLGPGIIPAVNALFLGYVMYRARLVPRIIPTVGFIGVPLLLASAVAIIFGGWDQVSTPAALFALPIAAWEFSLGVWLTVKGFKQPPPMASVPSSTAVQQALPVN